MKVFFSEGGGLIRQEPVSTHCILVKRYGSEQLFSETRQRSSGEGPAAQEASTAHLKSHVLPRHKELGGWGGAVWAEGRWEGQKEGL